MEKGGLAAGKSIAAARDGWIVFEDEAGQSLTPPRARSWGRRGTPVVRVRGRGSGRVSMAGMTCCRPGAPPDRWDAGVRRRECRVAHRVPAAHLRAGPEPAGGHLVAGQARIGNLAAADLGQITRAAKGRLKQIQYRPDFVDSCLAGTGLITDD